MSTAASGPVPYRVVYSERVRQRLMALTDIARERGDGEASGDVFASAANAQGLPACQDKKGVGCVWDNVLILDGAAMQGTTPLMSCVDKKDMPGVPDPKDCKLNYAAIADHVAGLAAGKGEWDQLVIMGADIAPAKAHASAARVSEA